MSTISINTSTALSPPVIATISAASTSIITVNTTINRVIAFTTGLISITSIDTCM